ncbi:hypothetical protein [Oryza sativa Japonica Group]|uniref:Uncharacterized protein n=1 Tax=Oryza sativa subsp. japonica TaxID=39947 RepID=Q5NBA2_ORYSJ|nr:hypothetical protein [Oryza sativa Japonica Group]BAD81254.1 hypothetical protein [Oryza sativa Japonica Group]
MRSSDFQTAAVGIGFALSCGVLLVVMSLVLPLPRLHGVRHCQSKHIWYIYEIYGTVMLV